MKIKTEQETRTKGKKDIQVNIANKNLKNFLKNNPVIEAILNNLNERRERLESNVTKLNELRNAVKERIDKHLKESKSPLDMIHEGIPLGKGRYHAPYAYARKINPNVYNSDNLYKKLLERGNELHKEYENIKKEKDELYKENEQTKRNYLHE